MATLRGIWVVLKALGGVILILIVATVGLALFNRPTIAVAAGSAVLMLGELLVILGAFTLGCLYAKGLMISGAEIGLRAQESDDERDIKMIETLVEGMTDIANTMLKATRNEPEPPKPMPQQSWLPAQLETPMLTDGSSIDGEFKIN